MNAEIDQWLISKSIHILKQNEIIKHASPAFVVHRYLGSSDGKQIVKSRVAVNFTELNNNTYRYINEYDITIEELQVKLSNYAYFNATDISKYFYCIPVAEESKQYGGITWFNLNRRKMYGIMDVVMHGLTDAPIYGQELTAAAYSDADCVTVQDDIFGGAGDLKLAVRRFINMLEIAKKRRFRLGANKTFCAVRKIQAVGYNIDSKGIIPLSCNCTKALCFDISLIGDYKGIRCWCGALNFLNGYIPQIAIKTQRLKEITFRESDMEEINKMELKPELKRKLKDGVKADYNDAAKEIIMEINDAIQAIPLLYHIDHRQNAGSLLLKADTSIYGIGSSLWQNRGHVLVLCKLYGKALTKSESNYSSTEREALGFIKAVERWRKVLVRKHFFAMTDHKSLLSLFGISECKTKNYKLIRFRWRLSEYLFSMIHVKGNSIQIAIEDYLSRYSKSAIEAKRARENGNTVDLNDVDAEFDFRLNFIQSLDIELLEVIGYEYSDEVIIDCDDMNMYNINKLESLKDTKQEIIFSKFDKIDKFEYLEDKSMKEFKISCDIANLNKNNKLKYPLSYNLNVINYADINKYNIVEKANDLRDIALIT